MVMSIVSKLHSAPRLAMARGRPLTSERIRNQESIAREPPTAHAHSDHSQPARVNRNLRWAGRLLAWSALIAIAILGALVLQNLAASAALVAQRRTELPAACRAALAAGDNVRESFLAHSCAGAFDATSKA